MKVIDE